MSDLRTLERESLRAFVQSAADEGYLSGRVLDYGCGKSPYRDIVEAAGGGYVGFDDPDYPANTSEELVGDGWSEGIPYDTVLCTQVVQYVPDPGYWLREMPTLFGWRKGVLVLTYPTSWPETEPEDLYRFTKAGMERLLIEAGFEILVHEGRAQVTFPGWPDVFVLGYGVVARA